MGEVKLYGKIDMYVLQDSGVALPFRSVRARYMVEALRKGLHKEGNLKIVHKGNAGLFEFHYRGTPIATWKYRDQYIVQHQHEYVSTKSNIYQLRMIDKAIEEFKGLVDVW